MFFGNMQSFYRRNSIHNQSTSHGSTSKPTKEFVKRVRHLNKKNTGEETEDNCSIRNFPTRRRSFSISRNNECEQLEEYNSNDVPIIKIELFEPKPTKQRFNILKEKEKALWYNSGSEPDNSERLGPNTNNIIEQSLENDKRREDKSEGKSESKSYVGN